MNGIFSEGAIAIGESLKDKKYLEVFVLKKNEIGLQGIRALKDVLNQSKTIKELNLAGNNIGDEGAIALSEALVNCRSLTILGLDSNKISNSGVAAIAKNLCNLDRLQFGYNCVSDENDATPLTEGLSCCINLKILSLEHNKVGPNCAEAIARSLKYTIYRSSLLGL